MITPEAINFMATHARGLICVAMTGERLDEMDLSSMSPDGDNTSLHGTAFTVSIDLKGHAARQASPRTIAPGRFVLRSIRQVPPRISRDRATCFRFARVLEACWSVAARPRLLSISLAWPASIPPA
jgi:hypothetical protein